MTSLPRAPEQDPTYAARRKARFLAARARIQKIITGEPTLTQEQRAQLALLLHPGTGAGRG